MSGERSRLPPKAGKLSVAKKPQSVQLLSERAVNAAVLQDTVFRLYATN
jgi:hypothetical protein